MEAVQADLHTVGGVPADEDRGGREVAVEHVGAVAVGDGLHDLLEDAEALVEGEVRVLAQEDVEREPVFEGLEEHGGAQRPIIHEGAVGEDAGVLANLGQGARLAASGTLELGPALDRGRRGHEIAAHPHLVVLDGLVASQVLLVAAAVVNQGAELIAAHDARRPARPKP